VEARTEIRHVKHPAKHQRRVHVANTEPEDGEQHHDYGADEHRDLQKVSIGIGLFASYVDGISLLMHKMQLLMM